MSPISRTSRPRRTLDFPRHDNVAFRAIRTCTWDFCTFFTDRFFFVSVCHVMFVLAQTKETLAVWCSLMLRSVPPARGQHGKCPPRHVILKS